MSHCLSCGHVLFEKRKGREPEPVRMPAPHRRASADRLAECPSCGRVLAAVDVERPAVAPAADEPELHCTD